MTVADPYGNDQEEIRVPRREAKGPKVHADLIVTEHMRYESKD